MRRGRSPALSAARRATPCRTKTRSPPRARRSRSPKISRRTTRCSFFSPAGAARFLKARSFRGAELQDITAQLLACGADIVEINTIRKRLSAVKGGRFARHCAPAHVFAVILSDIVGDPVDMIASGPVSPGLVHVRDALAAAEKYALRLSDTARGLLAQETPKTAGQRDGARHRQRPRAVRRRGKSLPRSWVYAGNPYQL